MNKTIKFSHNWNHKLDCDIFTTIRKYEKSKSDYYKPGDMFDVLLCNEFKTRAELIGKSTHIFGDLVNWQLDVLRLDVGLYESDKVCDIFAKFKINLFTPVMVLKFRSV